MTMKGSGRWSANTPMEPFGLTICYEDAETGSRFVEEHDGFASFANERISVEASFDGEVVQVAISPLRPIRMKLAQIKMRHAFASDERVLLNGYQSWTDTVERLAFGRMRSSRNAPWASDRSTFDGDDGYWSAHYTGESNQIHAFTYATFRRGEDMVLVGSLDESRGFTLIRVDAPTGTVTLEAEPPARELAAEEHMVVGRYAIARGTLDECYDRWFELAGVAPRPAKPLIGYTSRYRHQNEINEEKLERDLAGMAELNTLVEDAHIAIGAEALALFQIDEGYCKVGDWLEVDAAKFPGGLAPLAQRVLTAGYLPGIWIAPFVCEENSRLARECSDWLLRDQTGTPIRVGSQWAEELALDTRNVEVRSYVLNVLQTMTRDWGFRLLKADLLYAACKYPHDGLNQGELMADALDLLRRGAGEETLILACGVPLGSAFGKVEYCRIGYDVGLDWDDKLFMRAIHRERVSAKHSLSNTYARAPLDGRAFGSDPDAFSLRDGVWLTQSQRDELLFADADCSSVLLTSDDMGAWSESSRARYKEALHVFLER